MADDDAAIPWIERSRVFESGDCHAERDDKNRRFGVAIGDPSQ